MIEDLKSLKIGDSIKITNEHTVNVLGDDDIKIENIESIYGDQVECFIMEFKDHFLISHNFEEDFSFYIMEIHSNESFDDLNEDVTISINGKELSYYPFSHPWFSDDREYQMCLYENIESENNRMLIVNETIYIGIEISESEIEA